jgi:hypothetical protein
MELPPSPSPAPYQRSISLTLACALAFLSALQCFAFAYGPDFRHLGETLGAPWLPTFILVSSLLAMPLLVALWWRMRRWALWGFLALTAMQSVTFASLGGWRVAILVLVLPALVAAAGAWNWPQLR